LTIVTAVEEAGAPPRERHSLTTLSIDTGGTFTDGYLTDGARTSRVKVDTTPDDLSRGVLACVDAAAASWGLRRRALLRLVDAVRLSTTIGTNTLINRDGPTVGLLLGEEIVSVARPRSASLPLLDDTVETIADTASGDDATVLGAVHRLLERGSRIIVIALGGRAELASRERRVRSIITADYPRHYLGAVPVLASHEVTACPDARVRVETAVLNAYLHPVMSRFLYRVEDDLRRDGFAHPLQVANADGGTSRVAKTTALRTLGSGPAGGAAGAAEIAAALELESVVTLDVGGTSSDIAVIHDGRWTYEVQPSVAGVTVSLPVVKLVSVGVGGGSILRGSDAALTVGPDSAGAQPGPACFGLGGADATLTDAALMLGILDPVRYLGGRKRLDVAAAERAMTALGEPLGMDAVEAARAALRVAAEQIATSVQERLAAAGQPPESTWLFAIGGAGGMLAARVARQAGLAGAVAFPLSPVFSAFGLSRLQVQHTYEIPGEPAGRRRGGARGRPRASAPRHGRRAGAA
jgi:N-methylhydantoinase A